MAAFDRLPPPLRHWLAQEAVLPWSPRSVLKIWQRALQETGGDDERARARLRAVERNALAADQQNWAIPKSKNTAAKCRYPQRAP